MVTTILTNFANWLSGTALTAFVAGHFWVVPLLQTIHILAIAGVLVSVALINLRIVGVLDRGEPVQVLLDRYLRPVGISLAILAITGFLLIAGEPGRAIFRALFWVKLALIVAAALLTWSHRSAFAVDGAGGGIARKGIAVLALLLWLGVIVAGRWIAYVEAWPGAPA